MGLRTPTTPAERPAPPPSAARPHAGGPAAPRPPRRPATGPVVVAMPPLDPAVWVRRPRPALPYPLDEPGCRLFARARQALWLGVGALGIGPGDEVLAPAYHHGSEIEALERAGVRCRFYEVGERLEPDEAELEGLLSERTRALQIVHYLGFPQDAPRWRRWCDAHGVRLIEDAAHAWLSSVGDRPTGSFGDLSIFCLYKTVGVPDGGAVLCRGPAPQPSGSRPVRPVKLALEHALWIATRSTTLTRIASRLRGRRAYDSAVDFALGDPRPASLATLLALGRVADQRVAARRRANYEELQAGLPPDLVPAPFRSVPPGACPFVLPVAVRDKGRVLHELRRAAIRPLDLWSVPHPSVPEGAFPRSAALRREIIGLPVHQELHPRDIPRIAAAVRAVAPTPAAA
jgi:dTDP-4-amino-4,6-dideoxygalactose transaminase